MCTLNVHVKRGRSEVGQPYWTIWKGRRTFIVVFDWDNVVLLAVSSWPVVSGLRAEALRFQAG